MSDSPNISYLAPIGKSPEIPLARYLPPCPPGEISQWLEKNAAPGSWILDPFCSTPLTAIQAAGAGYRVLAASNNPLLAFELEMLCNVPDRNDLQAALAELASTPRGDGRLEALLQSYYLTECATCGREIQADSFIWKRGEQSPYARIYHCPHCGDEGLHPAIESDADRLTPLLRSEPLHRSRALQKATLTGMDEDERKNVEEALKAYPVRALVVIVNLLNRLDAYPQNSPVRRMLQAMLLPVLDAGSNLWPYPEGGEPPHLLQIPTEYVERNLWKELEGSIDLWQQASIPTKVALWPDLVKGPGISLFPGRAKELNLPGGLELSAALCTLPRTSQAFWTLSALWSAWLWGKEISARYAGVLGRRRFDWHWHTRALHSPLEAVNRLTKTGTPVLGLISNAVPGFLLSAAAAASGAGFVSLGLACKEDRYEVQYNWRTANRQLPPGGANPREVMRNAIRKTLMSVGQPVTYLAPFAASVDALAEHHLLPLPEDPAMPEKLSEIQAALTRIFLDRTFMHHYDSVAQEIEPGFWYLENPENCASPLDDRVEKIIVNHLLNYPKTTPDQVERAVFSSAGGIIAPADALIQSCLSSYAELCSEGDAWQIKPGESPAERKADLQKMLGLLQKIANRIGLTAAGDQPVTWKAAGEEKILYRFFLGASSIFSDRLTDPENEGGETVYVFPGSRAALLQYKLDHNPRLLEQTRSGWHFLKFRYLSALAQKADLNLELWELLLDGDPLSAEKDTQLSIFL